MPSDKRQRQREGREAAREAAKQAQRRAARKRQVISAVVLVVAILAIGLLISRGGDDGEPAAPSTTTTTAATVPGDTSTTVAGEAAAVPAGCPATDGSAARRTAFDDLPPTCIDPARSYEAVVETDAGTFTIDFDEKKAPMAVNSFIFLARQHYYDGVPFHRVIPGFVVQGGDGQRGDGTGGPGYELKDELPQAGEYKVGSLAMANSGPDTAGSQFFVVTGSQGVALPPKYTLFGTVTEGLDVVKKIEADGTSAGTPSVKHSITRVTVTES